jgi:hypothetical protein
VSVSLPTHRCEGCLALLFGGRLCDICRRNQPPIDEEETFDEAAYRALHRSLAEEQRRAAAEEARLFELERQSVEPVSVRIARQAGSTAKPVNVNPWGELSDD